MTKESSELGNQIHLSLRGLNSQLDHDRLVEITLVVLATAHIATKSKEV